MPSVVENHSLHSELSSELALFRHSLVGYVLMKLVPGRIERLESGFRSLNGLQSLFFHHPLDAVLNGLSPKHVTPIEHNLGLIMTQRSLGFPEETQLRTDVAALLHHAESGLHPSETLAARDCQAVCVVVVEILIERHPVGE